MYSYGKNVGLESGEVAQIQSLNPFTGVLNSQVVNWDEHGICHEYPKYSILIKGSFYLVHCIERGMPTRTHDRYMSALSEAERLARQHPRYKYHILRAIGYCVTNGNCYHKIGE